MHDLDHACGLRQVYAEVHAHPRASLMCTLLGLQFKSIFGTFDPNAMALAAAGVPIFPRSILIHRYRAVCRTSCGFSDVTCSAAMLSGHCR